MGWPYNFIDLTDAQKEQRRALLDRYATLAQISAIVPLLAVQLYFFLCWLDQRKEGQNVPGLRARKEERLGHRAGTARVKVVWSRFSWWCGGPLEVGNFYSGSRGEVLAAVSWFTWLLFLCFPQIGDDYLHFTKRFGIVAASQLPLHYLLAMKSPYSPIQILTRRSHETLNTFHQLLGRVILCLLYLHVGFYLNFYLQKDLLASKIREFYIMCGIFGIISLTIIGTTALAPVRRWNYRVFYFLHMTFAGMILFVLPYHVSHIRLYVYEAGAVYLLNVLLRGWTSAEVSGTLKLLPGTNLVEINIPFSGSTRDKILRRCQPGHHAYICLTDNRRSRTYRSNPFSVASVPSVDGQVCFVARVLDGNTSLLAQEANSAKYSTRHIGIEGPYGVNHSERLLHYDMVLFVAGGVGATFVVPLYRQLLADLSPSRGSYRRQKVTFVWIARKMADVTWAIPEDRKEREGFAERLEVYLTGSSMGDYAGSNGDISSNDESDWNEARVEDEDGIELEERKKFISNAANAPTGNGENGFPIHAGRPNLKKLLNHTLSQGSSEKVAVFVCGPNSLSRSLRTELHRWGAKGRDIFYWEEKFAL